MLLFEYKNLLIYITTLDNINKTLNLNLLGLGGDGDDEEEGTVPAAFSDDEDRVEGIACVLCKYGI